MRGITEEKIKRYEEALSLHMFLLNELGPTRFLFKVGEGEDTQKVRITLTNTIECSCGQTKDRCPHALFCLVKVFKVPATSELLFQDKFSEKQVNYILEGRFRSRDENSKKHEFLKRKEMKTQAVSKNGAKKDRRKLDLEEACPICYEELGTEQAVSSCRCCQNGFHSKCLITWGKHQMSIQSGKPIKCPMCRGEWDQSPTGTIKLLEDDIEKFLKKDFLHPATMCHYCGKKELVGPIFMNIFTRAKLACKLCFELKGLNKTNQTVTKLRQKDAWAPFDPRQTLDIARLALKEQSALHMAGFLCESLHSLGQMMTIGQHNLQVIGFDVGSIFCQLCKRKSESIIKIKRLPCEHKVCEECLSAGFVKGFSLLQFCCPLDGSQIFPAFPIDSRSMEQLPKQISTSQQRQLQSTVQVPSSKTATHQQRNRSAAKSEHKGMVKVPDLHIQSASRNPHESLQIQSVPSSQQFASFGIAPQFGSGAMKPPLGRPVLAGVGAKNSSKASDKQMTGQYSLLPALKHSSTATFPSISAQKASIGMPQLMITPLK